MRPSVDVSKSINGMISKKIRARRKRSTSWRSLQSPSLNLHLYKKQSCPVRDQIFASNKGLQLLAPIQPVLLVRLLLMPALLVKPSSLLHSLALPIRKAQSLPMKNMDIDIDYSECQKTPGFDLSNLLSMTPVRKVNCLTVLISCREMRK